VTPFHAPHDQLFDARIRWLRETMRSVTARLQPLHPVLRIAPQMLVAGAAAHFELLTQSVNVNRSPRANRPNRTISSMGVMVFQGLALEV